MKKTHCDRCGRFMYDEAPGIDYTGCPVYTIRAQWQSPQEFCSRRCANSYMDDRDAAVEWLTLSDYVERRKRGDSFPERPTTIQVQEWWK